MSKYTTQLRYICETLAGLDESAGENDVESIIENAAPKIFNFEFPIHEETHRLDLEKTILRHYYMREISAETVGLWKLWLHDTMVLIMPKYNELYRIAALAGDIDPFNRETVNETKNIARHDEGTNGNVRKDSDTPRGELDGVFSNKYLSYAQQTDGTVEADGTENTVYNRTVKHGDAADVLKRYKENVWNIDMMIVDELKPLFIGLW